MGRWARRLGIGVLALGAVGGVAAYLYWDTLRFLAVTAMITPGAPFGLERAPPPYDYAQESGWAALPTRADDADLVPAGETDAQADAPVDVFFVHPTTFLSGDNWNELASDAEATRRLKEGVLRGQASVFSACCRIYAPRYRQATFAAFIDTTGSGEKAIDLAYQDVLRAFDHYLATWNAGRPFILAGHSQGARHIFRLLKDRMADSGLRARFVAAYPVGAYESQAAFAAAATGIPLCAAPDATGCVATWNAVGPDIAHFRDTSGDICVNPLTWRIDGAPGDFAANRGSLSLTGQTLHPAIADATCTGGRLVVSEIRSDIYKDLPALLGRHNYHIIDYGLFWKNVRENARQRTAAFLAARPAAAGPP